MQPVFPSRPENRPNLFKKHSLGGRIRLFFVCRRTVPGFSFAYKSDRLLTEIIRSGGAFLEFASETDDLLYLSCLPWFDLTCCTNERNFDKDDAIPRITWGKYVRQDDRETLGLSIEVNHRFVDGVHLGRFYEALQQKINDLE